MPSDVQGKAFHRGGLNESPKLSSSDTAQFCISSNNTLKPSEMLSDYVGLSEPACLETEGVLKSLASRSLLPQPVAVDQSSDEEIETHDSRQERRALVGKIGFEVGLSNSFQVASENGAIEVHPSCQSKYSNFAASKDKTQNGTSHAANPGFKDTEHPSIQKNGGLDGVSAEASPLRVPSKSSCMLGALPTKTEDVSVDSTRAPEAPEDVRTWLQSLDGGNLHQYETQLSELFDNVSQIGQLYAHRLQDFFEDIRVEHPLHREAFAKALNALCPSSELIT